jgi:hypothetical protein
LEERQSCRGETVNEIAPDPVFRFFVTP